MADQSDMEVNNQAANTGEEATTATPANSPEDDRKVFAGGLPQEAKEEDIREHFSQFGEIEAINLKTDSATGRSRGFAFIIFKTEEGLQNATVNASHNIKEKKVAVKKAQTRPGKIYVGKLKAEITDDQIKTFFSQFGTISNIEQPFDKTKNERKNFCFITFEKEENAKKLIKEGTVYLEGHELDVKTVVQKPDPRMVMAAAGGYGGGWGPQYGGPMGGRGGGHAGGQWGGGYDGGYGGAGGWGGGYGDAGYGYGGYDGGYGGGYGGGYYPPQAAGGKTRGNSRGFMRGGGGQGRGAGGRGGGMQRQKPY